MDLTKWKSIDELLAIANEDKGNVALVNTFLQQWAKTVEECEGRLKTFRGFFEWQYDLSDKMLNISWEMIEHSQKTEAFENRRRNLDPVFSDKFTERMAESVATNDQKF